VYPLQIRDLALAKRDNEVYKIKGPKIMEWKFVEERSNIKSKGYIDPTLT